MGKKEKVILVEGGKLGKEFQTAELRRGFVVNYLWPEKKVKIYNPKSLSWMEKRKLEKEQKKIEAEEKAQDLYKKVNNFTLTFTLKKNEKGEPFGSIGFKEILQELENHGIHLEKSHLLDFYSLDKLGENELQVKLNNNITANLKIMLN